MDKVRGPWLKILMFVSVVFTFISASDALAFTINVINPTNSSYQWTNFTLNVTTSINTNCSYFVINQSNTVLDSGEIPVNDSQLHNTTLDINKFAPGYTYTINVTCVNSTDANDVNSTTVDFKSDYDCGDYVTHSWVLGHDLNCSGYSVGLDVVNPNIVLEGDNHIIIGDSSSSYGIKKLWYKNI